MTARSALLLVAHGSRDPRHAATVGALGDRVRALRPGLRVETSFLDHCAPAVPHAVDRLAADGVREVTAVPLLLTRAFHATTDVPAALGEAAARYGGPSGPVIRRADVLGPSALLVEALERRLREAGAPRRRASTGVVLAAAGSSDPGAVAAVAAVARDWRRAGGWFDVRAAYASTALPDTAEAVRALREAGARHVVVAPYMLAPGFLPDRVSAGAAAAGARVTAAVLGDAPEVARLVLWRHDRAVRTARVPLSV